MRRLKLFTLVCLGALIATDDASALGRRRKKKDCDNCGGAVAMPVYSSYGGSGCGGCGGGYASSGWAGGAYASDSGWTGGSYATGSGWTDTGSSFAQPMPSSGAVVSGYTADAVPSTTTSTSFYQGTSGNVVYPGTTYQGTAYPYHGATSYYPSGAYHQGASTWGGGYSPSGSTYRSGAGMGFGSGNWGMNSGNWGTGMMNRGGFGGGRNWR